MGPIPEQVDYVIIGSGLAGMTAYRMLEGARVVIIDPHPARHKLGESIAPDHFVDPLIDHLSLEARKLPSYSPKRGVVYVGEDSVAAFPTAPNDYQRVMHIRREELEEMMISLWKIPIHRERVTSIDFDEKIVRTPTRAFRVAGQILDCSGPARFIARALGATREMWPSFSSWMYFDIRRVVEDRFEQFLRRTGRAYARFDNGVGRRLDDEEYPDWSPGKITWVSRVRDGSFAWSIPLYNRTALSFGVTSRHGPISREDLVEIAKRCIAPCYDLDARPFDGSSAYNRYHVFNHFSHDAARFATKDWILLGDAATFGEPIYSTGTAIAVSQALFVGKAIQDGGWSQAKADEYGARCARLATTSREARKYFFQPPDSEADARNVRMFRAMGLTGTPFQLTMANNYGLAVAGLKEFAYGQNRYGSKFRTSEETMKAQTDRARALLEPLSTSVPPWEVAAAYACNGGVQIHWCYGSESGVEVRPDVVIRVEPVVGGQRFAAVVGDLGTSILNLPDRGYPMSDDVQRILRNTERSIRDRLESWVEFVVGHAPNSAGVQAADTLS